VRRLIEVYEYKPSQVAKKLGEAPSTISNLMKLSAMPLSVKNKIEDNIISSTLALEIARQFTDEKEFVTKINELADLAAEEAATGEEVAEEENAQEVTNSNELELQGQSPSELSDDDILFMSADLSPKKPEAPKKKAAPKAQPKKKQAQVTSKHVKAVIGETNPLNIAHELALKEIEAMYAGEKKDFFVTMICLLKKKGTTRDEILSVFHQFAQSELRIEVPLTDEHFVTSSPYVEISPAGKT